MKTSYFRLVLSVLSSLSLTACLGGGGGGGGGNTDSPTEKACRGDYEETYQALEIKGGHHLYFESEALERMHDQKNLISAELSVEIEGKHNAEDVELELGLNGISLTHPKGKKHFDFLNPWNKNSKSVVQLHLFTYNGSGSIFAVLSKIREQKGQLRISLVGKKVKVVSASLTIKGYEEGECATPTPTPPVAPTVKIDSALPASGVSESTDLRVEFSSDQAAVVFLCSVDGAAESECASPFALSQVSDGDHTFSVRARNAAGLYSEAVQHAWTVNAVTPSVLIDPVPAITNSDSISVSFSSLEAGSFECAVDGGEAKVCSSPLSLFALADGLHNLSIVFVDSYGRKGEPSSVQWKIDRLAPKAQISASVPAAEVSSSNSREISFIADESAAFECSIDGAPFAACASPVKLESLSEGEHRFEVRAIDEATNVGSVAGLVWISDFTAPTIALGNLIPEAGLTNQKNLSVEFSANEPAQFECSIDGSEFAACQSPAALTDVIDGEHTVSIVAIDRAGLRSAATSLAWVVDSTAPRIEFSSILPSSNRYLSSSDVSFEVAGADDVELQASLNGEAVAVAGTSVSLIGLAEGDYNLQVSGADEAGNLTNVLVHEFTIDQSAPVISLASAVTVPATRESSNSFTFSANETASYECELNGAGFIACESPVSYASLIDGEHEFRVRAIDQTGNVSAIFSHKWVVDTTAPLVEVSVMQTNVNSFNVQMLVNEPGSTFACSLDGAPEQACTSPYMVSGLSTGEHVLAIRATDALGNSEEQPTLVSLKAVDPLVLQFVVPAVSYTNATSFSFEFSANHSDAAFYCSLDNGNAVACSSPVSFHALGDGQHSFRVWAVDRYGQSTPAASHSWTVDTIAPSILSSSQSILSTSITLNWSTNELATNKLNWGPGTDSSRVTAESSTFATSHSVRIIGLSPNTIYTVQAAGRDRAGNQYAGQKLQIRTRF